MDKFGALIGFIRDLVLSDPKAVLIATLLGTNVYSFFHASERGIDCDQRVRSVDKLYQDRYNESISEMAINYSKAIVRCEEEKRQVIVDGYRKIDSLQVRYRKMENKINHYMSLQDGK